MPLLDIINPATGKTIAAAPLGLAGVKREHIARLVDIALADTCHRTNPRPCTKADFEQLFPPSSVLFDRKERKEHKDRPSLRSLLSLRLNHAFARYHQSRHGENNRLS